jgi:fatty-acyl-CoA synthase
MNVGDLLTRAARLYGDQPAVVDGERSLTFAELDDRANRVGNALLASGLAKGDRVAVLTENRMEWFDSAYGLFKSGLVGLSLNPRLAPAEISYLLEDSGASLVIVSEQCRELLDASDLGPAVRVVELGDEYEQLLAGASAQRPAVDVEPADVARIQYSSGTTGKPKGVIHTHGNFIALVLGTAGDLRLDERDVFLHVAPLGHVSGGFSPVFIACGVTQVIHQRFDPIKMLEAIPRHGVTTLLLVPTMLYMLLDAVAEHEGEIDTSSLRTVIYVAAPMSPAKLEQCIEVFGPVFMQTYGSTEALGGVTFLHQREHVPGSPLLASAGRPALIGELAIVDEDGAELPAGQVGEIVVRGEHVTPGYWNKPEATEAAFSEGGWYHTNDLAHMDEHGYVFIVDRKNDMIISGGFNVYAVEVEHALIAHEAVEEAAVFGVPHETWGESVTAVVRLKQPGTVDAEALTEWCREHLAGYKVPKLIDVVEQPLPRNPVGKVLRREIREPYWKGQARQVG